MTIRENRMFLFFMVIITMIVLGIWGFNSLKSDIMEFSCGSFVIMGFVMLVPYALLSFDYIAAGYQAKIINAEFGTDYTQEQVFYARSVIEEIRQLDRKRVEINGDLLKGN